MRRLVYAVMVGAALSLLTAVPASAQYEEPPAEEPQQPRTVANVSSSVVSPGDPVTVTVPPVFAPGTPVVVNLARAQQGAAGDRLGTGNASSNGSVDETVGVPQTDDGVYFLYVTGVDADGNPVVAIVAIVIDGGSASAAAVESDAFAAGAHSPRPAAAFTTVPAAVADVQSGMTPDTEAAVVEAVTQQGAGVVLSPQGTLSVRTPASAQAADVQSAGALPATGGDGIATQVTVGAALLLAGTGLVLLRRRGGFAK